MRDQLGRAVAALKALHEIDLGVGEHRRQVARPRLGAPGHPVIAVEDALGDLDAVPRRFPPLDAAQDRRAIVVRARRRCDADRPSLAAGAVRSALPASAFGDYGTSPGRGAPSVAPGGVLRPSKSPVRVSDHRSGGWRDDTRVPIEAVRKGWIMVYCFSCGVAARCRVSGSPARSGATIAVTAPQRRGASGPPSEQLAGPVLTLIRRSRRVPSRRRTPPHRECSASGSRRARPFGCRTARPYTRSRWAVHSQESRLPRGPRAFVRVSGPQAGDYLQRMVSNDVLALAPGGSCDALLLTPKARVIATLRVLRRADDDFLLLTEPELGEIGERPPRSDAVRRALRGRARGARVLRRARGGAAAPPNGVLRSPYDDFGIPGARDARREAPPDAPQLDDQELERLRIEAGTPRFGREIDDRVLPAEAGLDERARQLHKGCYPGQEPVARLRYRGHVNRSLRVLRIDAPASRRRSTPPIEHDGKVVGRVTSALPVGVRCRRARLRARRGADRGSGDRRGGGGYNESAAPVAQGIERSPAEAEARGSNPLGRTCGTAARVPRATGPLARASGRRCGCARRSLGSRPGGRAGAAALPRSTGSSGTGRRGCPRSSGPRRARGSRTRPADPRVTSRRRESRTGS